jgi:AcrR family transcriptional regulator
MDDDGGPRHGAHRVQPRVDGRGEGRAKVRDAEQTRGRILDAAMAEFAQHGPQGARVDRIAREAGVNVRMLYHYFGEKEGLYLAVLEAAYLRIRSLEEALARAGDEPVLAMTRLIDLTFDFLVTDPYFARLIMHENLTRGAVIRKSEFVARSTQPLVAFLERILSDGQARGCFRTGVGAQDLYIAILALCFVHVTNRYTLSSMFAEDLSDSEWLARRKSLVRNIILTWCTAAPTDVGAAAERSAAP